MSRPRFRPHVPTDVPTELPTEQVTPEPPPAVTETATPIPTEIPTVVAPTSTPVVPVSMSAMIVRLAAGLSLADQATVIARYGGVETSSIPVLRMHMIEVPSATIADALLGYRADPQVVSAELDKTRAAETAPSDPAYPDQWALPRIGWDTVFGSVTPSGSSKLAILDTGIDAGQPDLNDRVLPGYSAFGLDPATDPNGHGTHMAGIAAAKTDNGAGVAGVAYAGVSLLPVQVLASDGTGQDSDIITGLVWAVENGADVILMAFSNPGYSPALQAAVDYAWSSGAVLVAAAGNDGLNLLTYPAGDSGVMGISATDANDALDAGSNYGANVFLAAPGVNIAAPALDGGTTSVSGTSASAALVAGAAAFMKAVDPGLSNGTIVGRLARNADPAGTADQTGNGRLNLARALSDTNSDPVKPAGAPPVGNGGPFVGPYVIAARSMDLTFAVGGGGSVTINLTNAGTVNAAISCGGTGTSTTSQTVTSTCTGISFSNNSATGTFSATGNGTSYFAGWSSANNFTGCTGTTNPCSFAIAGSSPRLTVTFSPRASTTTTAPNATATYGDSSVTLNATVTSGAGTVNEGTVTFTVKDGATTIGSVTSGTVTSGAATRVSRYRRAQRPRL